MTSTMFFVFDCETTGLDPTKDQVVEVACTPVEVHNDQHRFTVHAMKTALCSVSIPISPEVSAIHHITNDMLRGQPTFKELWDNSILPDIFATVKQPDIDMAYAVAHNAAFDNSFLNFPMPVICTYKLAYNLLPDAPSYGNQVLRYYLNLNFPPDAQTEPTHRAGPDTVVTARLFLELFAKAMKDWNMSPRQVASQAQALSARPLLFRELNFGKHKDQPCDSIPSGYWRWVLSQDFDEDVKYTARYHLGEVD